MCFGGGQVGQPIMNPAPNPVDDAYKSVVATSEPIPQDPAATPSTTTGAASERTARTGVTFQK